MKFTRVFAFMALAGLAGSAYATNGYFSHGYGMKAKGMGGAATASSDDAFVGANNPAAAAFAGNRIDLGADLFSPIREATHGSAVPFARAVLRVIPTTSWSLSLATTAWSTTTWRWA